MCKIKLKINIYRLQYSKVQVRLGYFTARTTNFAQINLAEYAIGQITTMCKRRMYVRD